MEWAGKRAREVKWERKKRELWRGPEKVRREEKGAKKREGREGWSGVVQRARREMA